MEHVRVGLFDHFGWAVAVTAGRDHQVLDRRRLTLVEPDLTPAPIHYEPEDRDVATVAALVAQVRASVARMASAAFDDLAAALPAPIASLSLRSWPADFPTDVAIQRRVPYESRADAIMYRQVLAQVAGARGWDVLPYDAKAVLGEAAERLGPRTDDVLQGPRSRLGPPWTKDHRIALAATIVAG